MSVRTKAIPVPESEKGYIIGPRRAGLHEISQRINARVFRSRDNEICVEGTSEQIQMAENLIEEKLEEKNMGKSAAKMEVKKEYMGLIMGKEGANRKRLETKSGARIRSLTSKEDEGEFGILEITGSRKNCERARSLIREHIISLEDKMCRKKLGGGSHFVCFGTNYEDATVRFELKIDNNTPKLDGFMKGERYRIETENQTDIEEEFSEDTISRIRGVLLKSLRHLHQVKDEKQLIIDLWCHFGKVFVHDVDEGPQEEKRGLTVDDVAKRLGLDTNKIDKKEPSHVLNESVHNEYWKVTFEEGVDPSYIDDSIWSESGDTDDQNPLLCHVHTQWRYDYAFSTPSGRYIRLKLWEGLSDKEPPREVKNLLNPVFLEGEKDNLVAWLCYPSTTIVKGEIMTPASKYDCRLKLRTGKRIVSPETEPLGSEEENKMLSDYLSKCTLDKEKHHLDLPSSELPEGFLCSFYRSSKERMLTYCDGDNEERFTVIVLEEEGWDSDSTEKRKQKQFGIRVVLDSWSDALLSGQWEPDEVVSKLPAFMNFFGELQDLLFE